jgi:chlorobactene glucosyltransferase
LSQQTDADLLIFTDADVDWRPNALTALVDLQQRTQADLLTVWPTQKTVTWAERLTVPNIALAIMAYLPLFGVHRLPFAIFAAANGQCMTFRRAAYDAVGGHAAVRARIVEDVALARLIKRSGQRLRMADGNEQINCRMYHNWPEVRDGLAKNIREGHGGTVMLLFSTLFHWLLFLLPWLWLGFGRKTRGWPKLPLLLTAISVGVRALAAKATRQRVRDALLMPVSVLLFTRIAARSIWWHWRGTVRWKGRTLS